MRTFLLFFSLCLFTIVACTKENAEELVVKDKMELKAQALTQKRDPEAEATPCDEPQKIDPNQAFSLQGDGANTGCTLSD